MSITLPNAVASYLAAIDAAAIFVTARLQVGADTVPGLRRRQCSIAWIVWVRTIEEAKQVAKITGWSHTTIENDLRGKNLPEPGKNLPPAKPSATGSAETKARRAAKVLGVNQKTISNDVRNNSSKSEENSLTGSAETKARRAAVASLDNLPDIVTAIEERAQDLQIPLTPHDKAIARARELSQRLDVILQTMRTSGALKAFNLSYKLHRHKMNGHARPYSWALNQLRSELIQFLVVTPREQMSPAALQMRLRAKFSWYQWYG